MRTAIFTALLLFATPVLAADTSPVVPPTPPAVTYDVWAFRWDGRQYVKQATHSLSTTDIKQATNYAAEVTSYAGWSATTNLPVDCVVHTYFHGPIISNTPPAISRANLPAKPTYSVWAYRLTDGQWVKDEKYSWTTTDPLLGLDYAKKVHAVQGWFATNNCPEPVAKAERYVDGGTVHGAEKYRNLPFATCDAAYGPVRPIAHLGYLQQLAARYGLHLDLNAVGNDGDYVPSNDFSSYDNSWNDIQNSLNIQAANNTQDMINTQNMLNTQNMINTENMVNSMQDMVNTQNMVDTQNMINAMNANP